MVDLLDELKGKKVKLTYNSTLNEIQREEGIVLDFKNDLFIIQSTYDDDKNIKFIQKWRIVRIEVLENGK